MNCGNLPFLEDEPSIFRKVNDYQYNPNVPVLRYLEYFGTVFLKK